MHPDHPTPLPPADDGYCSPCEDVRLCGTMNKCMYGQRATVGRATPLLAATVEAMRELLESHTAPFPPAEAGQAAQTAWAQRKFDAEEAARAILSLPGTPVAGADLQHVATVAEVHMSRYTLEWTDGPMPEGTKLYARRVP